LAAALLLVAGTAMANTNNDVNDPWDDTDATDEMNLYEIYNAIYGTAFTSTAGATAGFGGAPATVTGGMDAVFIADTGVFTGTMDGSATFQARYAAFEQRFGYYTNPGAPSGDPTLGADDGDFVHLFDVENPGNTVSPGPTQVLSSLDFPIGFYDNAPLGGAVTRFSEESLNVGNLDHMIVLRAMNADGTLSSDTVLIAFEDLPRLGDADYNDLVVEVTIPGFIPPPPVFPEPASAALLLIGLAGVAARRKFRF
jgi:hypothetical protein